MHFHFFLLINFGETIQYSKSPNSCFYFLSRLWLLNFFELRCTKMLISVNIFMYTYKYYYIERFRDRSRISLMNSAYLYTNDDDDDLYIKRKWKLFFLLLHLILWVHWTHDWVTHFWHVSFSKFKYRGVQKVVSNYKQVWVTQHKHWSFSIYTRTRRMRKVCASLYKFGVWWMNEWRMRKVMYWLIGYCCSVVISRFDFFQFHIKCIFYLFLHGISEFNISFEWAILKKNFALAMVLSRICFYLTGTKKRKITWKQS